MTRPDRSPAILAHLAAHPGEWLSASAIACAVTPRESMRGILSACHALAKAGKCEERNGMTYSAEGREYRAVAP